jgi:site-specific DNA-methyltransferase (adenine-specific)
MTKKLLGSLELNRIYQLDCIEGMSLIPDKSIDMILCDLPYGTTACKWDTIIPFDTLWEQYERIIKDNGAIILTASQPFTTNLINSKINLFRYELIWEKTLATNFMLVKKQPAKKHENICMFYKKQPTYNPQMEQGKPYTDKARKRTVGVHGDLETLKKPIENNGTRYPSSVQKFSNGNNKTVHPTQKPVALFEYLIRTYTNEGNIVLDNCMGSGTTAVACARTKRNFIGFETESEYVEIANKRLDNEVNE